MKNKKLRVAIFGISGYAGRKLLEILLLHPYVEVVAGFVAPDEPDLSISQMYPKVAKTIDLYCTNKVDWGIVEKNCDIVFLALPHVVSMSFVPKILSYGKRVIDLSADYRFSDVNLYEKWYQKHTSPELLEKAVYGLPELYREEIKGAQLIANPGCYPTSAILGLLPAAKKNIIKGRIIVNSLSGFTGAGRKPDVSLLFAEGNENSRAYKIGQHRHQPEIQHILEKVGCLPEVTFVPHLIPVNCGILTTMYVELAQDIDEKSLQNMYIDFYRNEPFVRVMDYGCSPEIKNVAGTNFCDIGIKKIDKNFLCVVSAIDNLVKGASGQAVQNMNIMMGFEETIPFYSNETCVS
ncbi:MAG: N-acetyl-gamma-glutamyl-phosphate reductase [bacterium]|nr:N-acetyl-gamma-glutamyl-phosphate reductase [bacterium]